MASTQRPRTSQTKVTVSKGSQDASDSEDFDLDTFQTSLDDSLSFAKALVQSWIPSHVDSNWKASASSEGNSSSKKGGFESLLRDRSRPARLGLGASVSALHQQQAEDRKLRQQLLSHTQSHQSQSQEDGSTHKKTYGMYNANNQGLGDSIMNPTLDQKNGKHARQVDSEEEEESRSGAIRARTTKPSDSINPFTKTSTGSTNGKNTIPSASSSLFNPPSSPLKPDSISPSGSPTSNLKKPVSTNAFYSSTPTAGLTKNQRKKEREREKKEMLKKLALQEIAKEEAQNGSSLLGNVSEEEGGSMEEHHSPKVNVKQAGPSPKKGAQEWQQTPMVNEDDEDGGVDEDDHAESIASSRTLVEGGNEEGAAAAVAESRKPKKRRKKLGKQAIAQLKGQSQVKQVLNLGK